MNSRHEQKTIANLDAAMKFPIKEYPKCEPEPPDRYRSAKLACVAQSGVIRLYEIWTVCNLSKTFYQSVASTILSRQLWKTSAHAEKTFRSEFF